MYLYCKTRRHISIQKNNVVQDMGSPVQLKFSMNTDQLGQEKVSDLSAAPQTSSLKLLNYFFHLLGQGFDPAGTTAGSELPRP